MSVQLSQILFQVLNFGIVFTVLTYLLYKPIAKILDQRSRRIAEGQKAANEAMVAQEKIEEMRAEVKKEIKQFRAKKMEEITAEADARKKELIARAKEEAKAKNEELRQQWEEEKAEEISKMKRGIIQATISGAEKIINTTLDQKSSQKMIDQEIDNILEKI